MGMFLNYQDISQNYQPNNLTCSFPIGKDYTKLSPVQASKPYEEYNVQGELIGYFWHHGETLNLEFNIDGQITVEDDALIYYSSNQGPSRATKGYVGQKAYNVHDKKSWECVAVYDDYHYEWILDSEFTYSEESPKKVYIDASDYLKDKYVKFTIYNFRVEPIYSITRKASTKSIFLIDSELSKKLVKGIYYCSLTVFNDHVNLPIFSSKDCVLSVK